MGKSTCMFKDEKTCLKISNISFFLKSFIPQVEGGGVILKKHTPQCLIFSEIYLNKKALCSYKFICIYVSYSWPNGWTEWADFLRNP